MLIIKCLYAVLRIFLKIFFKKSREMFGVYEICCTFALANEKQQLFNCKQHGTLAQVVEQWTENPCVGSSILPDTTP